jgi:hypothetical protein
MRQGCSHCHDTGWVCEEHPTEPMDHDDCGRPGMPCACPIGRDLEHRLDAVRVKGCLAKLRKSAWWSRDHKPNTQLPVLPDRLLWCLVKGDQRVEAIVRASHRNWAELRYLQNGELQASHSYHDNAPLQAAAAARRNELLARGWTDPGSIALIRWDLAGRL